MKHLARIRTNKQVTKRTQRGATAIEYGLIVGLIALGIVTGAQALGGNLSTAFTNLGQRIVALIPSSS